MVMSQSALTRLHVAGTTSSVRPDGQAAAAQAHQQDLLGDLLDLNDPEPAPASAAPPSASSNNGVQDLLGQHSCLACLVCLRPFQAAAACTQQAVHAESGRVEHSTSMAVVMPFSSCTISAAKCFLATCLNMHCTIQRRGNQ